MSVLGQHEFVVDMLEAPHSEVYVLQLDIVVGRAVQVAMADDEVRVSRFFFVCPCVRSTYYYDTGRQHRTEPR